MVLPEHHVSTAPGASQGAWSSALRRGPILVNLCSFPSIQNPQALCTFSWLLSVPLALADSRGPSSSGKTFESNPGVGRGGEETLICSPQSFTGCSLTSPTLGRGGA